MKQPMKKLTQFALPFNSDLSIQGEYEGNDTSGKAIIFSHGFGLQRNSRGFFTEISNLLKNEFLTVRFDYCQILPEKNATLTYPFTQQAAMLEQVIKFVHNEFQPAEINLIGHSMGCLVIGTLQPEGVEKTILLSSPPSKQFRNMRDYFSHKPGTKFNLEGISKVKRSDGSWTLIDPGFWPDLEKIDPIKMFEELSQKSQVYFVRALQDHVITDEPEESYEKIASIPDISYLELPGDHNFSREAREGLLKKIKETLN